MVKIMGKSDDLLKRLNWPPHIPKSEEVNERPKCAKKLGKLSLLEALGKQERQDTKKKLLGFLR